MYSRYSNVSIPQNYSGSRFKVDDEPSVKTHRASIGGAVKSAHSPSFASSRVENAVLEDDKENAEGQIDELSDFENDILDEELEVSDNNEGEISASSDEIEPHKEGLDLSKIKSILARFDKDAILILGLILLLMSDGDKKNDDVIALLALLLLG